MKRRFISFSAPLCLAAMLLLLGLSRCDADDESKDFREKIAGQYEFISHNYSYTVNPYHSDTFDLGFSYSSGFVGLQEGTKTGIFIDYSDDYPLIITDAMPDGTLADTVVQTDCPYRVCCGSYSTDSIHFTLKRFPCNITQYYSIVSGKKIK